MIGNNLTPFPAILLTTVLDEERMGAAVIVRATFDLVDGALAPVPTPGLREDEPRYAMVPSPAQVWIVSVEPWLSPLGPFDPDQPFRTGGVDLLVHGPAVAPGGEPAKEVALAIEAGGFRASAVAIGPRVWRRDASGALVPTDPTPFTTLPVGLDAAYGGKMVVDGREAAYPLNPEGKGFYLDEGSALHQPLPNIEAPTARIARWDDRPEPVGFGLCQYPHPLRVRESVLVDGRPVAADSVVQGPWWRPAIEPSHRMFNRAFPKLITPKLDPGDLVIVTGFTADGPLAFRVPPNRLRVRVVLGDKVVERTPAIEALGVDVPARRVFVGYRYPFRYLFVPHQERACTLFLAEA
jgi:hypothetical protein